jgi:hypothetical protein
VSWAHDDKAWERTITDFVLTLRRYGIDVDVDLFHVDEPDVNWAIYGPRAIDKSDFVLIAASSLYKARWEETSDPTAGAGAMREANVLKGLFNADRREFQRKVKVVVLPGSGVDDIPQELRAACRQFDVGSIDLAGLESLLRTLTGQPTLEINRVGSVPIFPASADPNAQAGTPQEQELGLRQRLSEVKERQRTASSRTTPSTETLQTQQSTLQAALVVIRKMASDRHPWRRARVPPWLNVVGYLSVCAALMLAFYFIGESL